MQAVHSHSARLAPRGRVVASQRPLTVSTRPSAPGARQKCQAAADAAEAPTGSATAAAAVEAAAAAAPLVANSTPLVYKGLVFDMDGTLTVGNIDYANMRQKVNIPVGDLFTVMESWDDGDRIKQAMDTILELEAHACAEIQGMPDLLPLLAYLKGSGSRVGLVTRNTTESLNAFFGVIGEEWRGAFDILLTRDNTPFVKPDKRCLLHFAHAWGLQPWELLMVGDSQEDIETACAAGTASCLIAGGGNETSALAVAAPVPLGAVPTFTVDSLTELQQRLEARDTALGWGASGGGAASFSSSSSSSSESEGEGDSWAGAPPAGLDFLDALSTLGVVQTATRSFPRIISSRLEVPPDAHPGDRVLHLGCGDGALTKLLFSSGLQVIGVDEDVAAAQRRGLSAVQLKPLQLGAGALEPELAAMGALFDAAVFHSSGDSPLVGSWWGQESLGELGRVLKPGGKLCVQAPVADEGGVRRQLEQAGFTLLSWQPAEPGCVRLVASARQGS